MNENAAPQYSGHPQTLHCTAANKLVHLLNFLQLKRHIKQRRENDASIQWYAYWSL